MPNATIIEVKKNFRRLALRYHPDTNHGNGYAEAWYREIQEAYETLTDTDLREAYLQQRWLLKSQGRAFTETIALTPPIILKQANELLEQVKNMDHFRMSHHLLQQQILLVLDDEKIDVLLSYNETDINREVGEIIIAGMFPLEYSLMKPVIKQLCKLGIGDIALLQQIKSYDKKRKQEFVWERYQGLIIFVITILLCAIIYFAAKK
ncbi:hypothetical protein BH10BAC3_BH10BAC3_39040 [soil metagenome]